MAIIKNNVVQNVAMWDGVSAWSPGEEYLLIDVTNKKCDPDDLYNPEDGSFARPAQDDD